MADLTFVQYDTAPTIFGTLVADSAPLDLTSATSVRFQMRQANSFRYVIDAAATIVTPAAGAVRYDLVNGDLDNAGSFIARWEVHFSDGSVQHSEPENTVTVDPA